MARKHSGYLVHLSLLNFLRGSSFYINEKYKIFEFMSIKTI